MKLGMIDRHFRGKCRQGIDDVIVKHNFLTEENDFFS